MNSAQKTKLKKLIVAVASRDACTIGELRMYPIPALMCPRCAGSVGGSTGEIELIAKAEQRNVSASATSATGAERASTSAPPTLGPAMNENARLPFRSELASR